MSSMLCVLGFIHTDICFLFSLKCEFSSSVVGANLGVCGFSAQAKLPTVRPPKITELLHKSMLKYSTTTTDFQKKNMCNW